MFPACDLSSRIEECNKMRVCIKRCKVKQQERFINTAAKRFNHAKVIISVLIPIS